MAYTWQWPPIESDTYYTVVVLDICLNISSSTPRSSHQAPVKRYGYRHGFRQCSRIVAATFRRGQEWWDKRIQTQVSREGHHLLDDQSVQWPGDPLFHPDWSNKGHRLWLSSVGFHLKGWWPAKHGAVVPDSSGRWVWFCSDWESPVIRSLRERVKREKLTWRPLMRNESNRVVTDYQVSCGSIQPTLQEIFHSQVQKVHSPKLFKQKYIREVVRIGSIIIFHLTKLWKVKFFILCDVVCLVRLQGKLEIDHSWEWKG